jgi:ADP-ribose pyrophosphatase YjhB (NUDIX family)
VLTFPANGWVSNGATSRAGRSDPGRTSLRQTVNPYFREFGPFVAQSNVSPASRTAPVGAGIAGQLIPSGLVCSERMLPVSSRWARFGPTERKWFMHIPRGGVCLSAFVIVRNHEGDVLLGRPRPHSAWAEKGCLPPFRVRELEERREWILPASHLLVDEPPSAAAKRVLRDWAGLRGGKPRLIALDSSLLPTGQFTGRGKNRRPLNHWAIGFVYEARSELLPRTTPWWSEMRFFPPVELRKTRVGRAHKDIIRYLASPQLT